MAMRPWYVAVEASVNPICPSHEYHRFAPVTFQSMQASKRFAFVKRLYVAWAHALMQLAKAMSGTTTVS
jgi:hypothetical protein